MITLNYCYRIYPDVAQQRLITEWLEICRGTYNYGRRQIKDWCNSRKSPIDRCSLVKDYITPADEPFADEYRQINSLPKAKKQYPQLKKVPSQVLQQAIKQLHKSWEFFRKRGYGLPRFKKYGQVKSLLFPQFKETPVIGNQLKLPKLGAVIINLHRPIPDGFKVKQVRLVRKADQWYAVLAIQCNVDVPDFEPTPGGHAIGVDIGLEKFLATSDGEIVAPSGFFRELQSKLKLLQRRLARKSKRSSNYEQARLKVGRTHHQIANTRKEFHYQVAHALCDSADMIFMEDIDYRTTAKGFLGKQMLDGAFGQFRSIVEYLCSKRGKFFGEVNHRGTSQECPECGSQVRKNLSVRVHECPHCQYRVDRDVASGKVIRNRGLASIKEKIVPVDDGERKQPVAVGLPGTSAKLLKSRQETKSRKGVTRKSK
ncbi:MAG: transposase [Coleofasciculus sp. G3-WIS-01]|uniref:RNA-guided endonuclease InsQ/TnpB family protein n=1 Tax=Coleofasciculus sp. G3-WIS-01 TaxID=3069528 RepID=UPI0032FCD0DE